VLLKTRAARTQPAATPSRPRYPCFAGGRKAFGFDDRSGVAATVGLPVRAEARCYNCCGYVAWPLIALPAPIPACMGTSANKKNKTKKVPNLAADGAAVKTVKARRRQRSRHVQNFASRSDFKRIRSLSEDAQKDLDKLRDDLQASIERTVRLQHRFVEELTKYAVGCNRTKEIVKALGIVPFYAEQQRKVVDKGIFDILQSNEVAAKLAAEEAAKKKKELHDANCVSCYTCANW